MQLLSDKECTKWCHNNQIALDKHGHPDITAAKGGREFAIPADAGQRIGDLPGQLFAADEYEDIVSCVTLSALFLWDCYVLVPFGKKALFYSHDEIGVKV